MESKYPNIDWSLINNPKLKTVIFNEYRDNLEYLSYLDNLISSLRSSHCECIQEKMEELQISRKTIDSGRNYFKDQNKLNATISELEFAKILTEKFSGIKFIDNRSTEFEGKSPDIFCREINTYFEVYRLGENPNINILIDKLEGMLKNFSYVVNVHLNGKLSIPKLRGEERDEQKEIVRECLEIFSDSFPKSISGELPNEIKTEDIEFKIIKTESGNGYVGYVVSDWIDLSEKERNDMLEYIKDWLVTKAEKRETFKGDSRNCSYIIILDSHEHFVRKDDINRLLYGKTIRLSQFLENNWKSEVSTIKKLLSWKEIEKAKNNGWESFLFKKYLIPHDYAYVDIKGIFFSEPSMKNISGVLFRNGKFISFYPNPFCSDEINNPDIQSFEM